MARSRYADPQQEIPYRQLPAAALRAVFHEGYGASSFRADLLSGIVVGVVALPLAMALAVAVGVPPQHGLYTAIIAGAVVAILGGSRLQVTGPTAAFIAILAPIQAKFGLSGLLVSGLMAGLMLVAMGLLRFGKFIEFVPHPVTTGFTAGIGTVIAALQLKDLLGLQPAHNREHFFERLAELWAARGTFHPWELAVGGLTLALLLLVPRLTKRVPAPLVALPIAAVAAAIVSRLVPGGEIVTIASRFSTEIGGELVRGIPRLPPLPTLPWGSEGFTISGRMVNDLLPGAFAIAMLGAIESLLSAVVADGMARTRHDPDAELLALGVGNVVAPFFGGIAATGAIARTATNVRSGGRSPIAAVVHALVVLAAVLAAAPLLGFLPMSALAALLVLVAWNMSDAKHFAHILRVAPRSDMAVLLTCYGLTVAFDMVVGVAVGMVLAAMLFMRRMAEVTRVQVIEGDHDHPALPGPVPKNVVVYDVSGALFFGAAQRAVAALGSISGHTRAVVFRLDEVSTMDATGLVALESALDGLAQQKTTAFLAGIRPKMMELLRRAGVHERRGVVMCESTAEALALAEFMSRDDGPPKPAAGAVAGQER